MALSHQQQEALAFITHFTGFLSLVGSSWIMFEIIKDKTKWKKTYHRLLFVMSFFDFLTSIAMGLSSIPIPRGTENVYYGFGNTTTCSVQGFFIHLSIIGPFYNACLSVYYVLKVRTGMHEKDILKYVEPFMHLICNVAAWTIAFVALFLGMYNNSTLWCSINDFPGNCQGGTGEPGPVPCERGYNAWIYRWAFYYGPLWLTLIIVPVMMVLLYAAVRQQEKNCERYDMEARCRKLSTRSLVEAVTSKRKVQWSKKVASQSLFYTISFYLTFIFATMNRLTQLIANKDYFALLLLHIMFAPLQGFFNFLVYVRPRFLRWYAKKVNAKNKNRAEERMINIIAASTANETTAQRPNTTDNESNVPNINSRYFKRRISSRFSDYDGHSFRIPSLRSTDSDPDIFGRNSAIGHSRNSSFGNSTNSSFRHSRNPSEGSAADFPTNNIHWWDKFNEDKNGDDDDNDDDSDRDSDKEIGNELCVEMKEEVTPPIVVMGSDSSDHEEVNDNDDGSENSSDKEVNDNDDGSENSSDKEVNYNEDGSENDNKNENDSVVELKEEPNTKNNGIENDFSKGHKNAIGNSIDIGGDLEMKTQAKGLGSFAGDDKDNENEMESDTDTDSIEGKEGPKREVNA